MRRLVRAAEAVFWSLVLAVVFPIVMTVPVERDR